MVLMLDGICFYAEDEHEAHVLFKLQLSPQKQVLSDAKAAVSSLNFTPCNFFHHPLTLCYCLQLQKITTSAFITSIQQRGSVIVFFNAL